jgi:hypothetical protein
VDILVDRQELTEWQRRVVQDLFESGGLEYEQMQSYAPNPDHLAGGINAVFGAPMIACQNYAAPVGYGRFYWLTEVGESLAQTLWEFLETLPSAIALAPDVL